MILSRPWIDGKRRLPALAVTIFTVITALGLLPSWAPLFRANAPVPTSKRILWQRSRLLGSPEPPDPYSVEKTFTRQEWDRPLYLAAEPGTARVWVVLQGGETNRASRVVAIADRPDAHSEATLLELDRRLIYGLTFHPGYRTNGIIYLFSNGPTGEADRTNRISRFHVQTTPANSIDAQSETVVLQWYSAGHDGGDLAFGHDGMLYITAGDGTSDSDGLNSGQDISNLLATLIRIDVDHPPSGQSYGVPADNPFVGFPGARPEIWAYGFRNPWRMGIDSQTGDIWVGNNGQDLWETAYLVHRRDNFGWSVVEGNHPFYADRKRGPTPIVPPTIEHSHSEFRSLTGGVVYYGDKFPELNGAYVYGDFSTGKIWGARHHDGKLIWHRELADTSLQIVCFCVDQAGDLLIADLGGGIYRLVPGRPEVSTRTFPMRLSETGLFISVPDHQVDPGLIPYSINAPGWADGATAERFIALPGDAKIEYARARGWNFTNGSVLLQTLTMETAVGVPGSRRRLESRVLLKEEGEWAAYTYRWNAEQTDGILVGKTGEDIPLEMREASGEIRHFTWHIPSRSECMMCHARAANFALGLCELQMNLDRDYGAQRRNQLSALQELDVLVGMTNGPPESLNRLVDPYDEHMDLDRRARSYLHANCSVCHVEAGGGNSRMELEFTRSTEGMNLVGARPQHDSFGLVNAMLVAPGEPERSVLLRRLSERGRGQMPPLAISRVDERAVALMRSWVSQLKPEFSFVREWKMEELAGDLDQLSPARPIANGRSVFERVGCAQCHRFEGQGGSVGPDLAGVGHRLTRHDLLESILEPSRVIADEYAAVEIQMKDGDAIVGRVEREDERELFVRTGSAVSEWVRVPKTDVLGRRKSSVSNMPQGIVNVLERDQILDLLAYLLSDGHAPVPAP